MKRSTLEALRANNSINLMCTKHQGKWEASGQSATLQRTSVLLLVLSVALSWTRQLRDATWSATGLLLSCSS